MTDSWLPPREVVTDEWLQTELRPELAGWVSAEERTLFDRLSGGPSDGMLIFGAGNLGRRTLAGLRNLGVEPLAFVDNRTTLHGTVVEGLNVLKPEDAAAQYGNRVVVVVAIWVPLGPLAFPTVAAQMDALGCERTIPFVPLFWKHQDEFLPNFCLDAPHRVYEDADAAQAAYRLLADESSRTQFLIQLSYLLSSMESIELDPISDDGSYFPPDLIKLSAREVFVDCGAYDGDSILSFVEQSAGQFEAIVAFEPDPTAASRLESFVDGLPPSVHRRVRIERKAVAAFEGLLSFDGAGTPESRISDSGEQMVACTTIDAALAGLAPTLIKMDIEGAEEDALIGATRTIRTHRPVLAICVYHRQSHLYRIPTLIRAHCPDYSLFMRRRGPDRDLVCFAVPNERLVLDGGRGSR